VRRAISGPLADRHQDASGAVVIVWLAALGFDVSVDVVGNSLVGAVRLVLVDHGGPLAVVAHASHEILDLRAFSSGERVASMA